MTQEKNSIEKLKVFCRPVNFTKERVKLFSFEFSV